MVLSREKRKFNDKHATVKARFETRRIAMEPFACIHIVTLASESLLKEMFGKQANFFSHLFSPRSLVPGYIVPNISCIKGCHKVCTTKVLNS